VVHDEGDIFFMFWDGGGSGVRGFRSDEGGVGIGADEPDEFWSNDGFIIIGYEDGVR